VREKYPEAFCSTKLLNVIANGGKVLIEDKNGVVHRVLFK